MAFYNVKNNEVLEVYQGKDFEASNVVHNKRNGSQKQKFKLVYKSDLKI